MRSADLVFFSLEIGVNGLPLFFISPLKNLHVSGAEPIQSAALVAGGLS